MRQYDNHSSHGSFAEQLKLKLVTNPFVIKSFREYTQKKVTCDSSIALKDLFYVGLRHLERVQVPNKDPGVDRLGVLRTRLVPNLAKAHSQANLVTFPGNLNTSLSVFFCDVSFNG